MSANLVSIINCRLLMLARSVMLYQVVILIVTANYVRCLMRKIMKMNYQNDWLLNCFDGIAEQKKLKVCAVGLKKIFKNLEDENIRKC